MASVGRLVPDQSARAGTMPDASPGNCRPVSPSSPKPRRYLSRPVAPSFWAMRMAPALEDSAITSAGVNRWVRWDSASWNVVPAMVRWSGTGMVSDGVMAPSCRAPETVTILLTEPGSYTSIRALLYPAGCGGWPGAPATMLAMARISPVWGSMITAIPDFAFDDVIR